MKKILVMALTVLIFITSVFSGCTLVEKNNIKYMDEVVATVKCDDNHTIEITKQDFLNYYYNYYDTFVNQQGKKPEEAAEISLNMLINQRLLVNKLKADQSLKLTQNDKNKITTQVFEYVDKKLGEFEVEIKNDEGIKSEEITKEEEKTFPVKEVFTPIYEYKQVLVDPSNPEGQKEWKIKYVNNEKEQSERPALSNIYKKYFWMESEKNEKGFTSVGALKSKISEYSDGIQEEAMKRFVKELKVNEEYRHYKDNSSFDIFMRDYNRVYKIYEDNAYIEKLEKQFQSKLVISTQDVINYMNYKISAQKELYQDKNGIYKAYNDAMKGDASTIYYHPTNNWFNVMHILVGYDDEQKEYIKSLDSDVESGVITKQQKEDKLEEMKSKIMGQARDSEGKLVGEKKSAIEINNEIQNAMNLQHGNIDAKIAKFEELMFKYSTDEGSFNKDTNYVIPLDSEFDSMVKPFADKSRELYKAGHVGAVSDIVMSEYGAHIIIYVGSPKNVVEDVNSLNIRDLIDFKLKPTSDKTLFDVACEGVEKSEFATYQSNLTSMLREKKDIKIYKDRYKDIFKK